MIHCRPIIAIHWAALWARASALGDEAARAGSWRHRACGLEPHRSHTVASLIVKCVCVALLASVVHTAAASPSPVRPTVIVVIGAPGTPEYGADFAHSADAWSDACKRASINHIEIGRAPSLAAGSPPPPAKTDRERFQEILATEAPGTQPLWIVLIGHGTYDGKEAKFNLRDLDFSDADLAQWLKPFTRPIAVIDCSSASAPFLNRLAAPGRVIITATRSGSEVNYARFGIYLADAIANPAADLDKDGQTSLLEAFLAASRGVEDFYQTAGRLATEHALLDDNGDGLGVAADWFQGTRATRAAKNGVPIDGPSAHQWFLIPSPEEQALTPEMRAQRNAVELKIEALRQKKSALSETDYYHQLDALLLTLARLQLQASSPTTVPAG